MKPGKSPGPDGLTTQYYRSFSDKLIPHFLSAFNLDDSLTHHSLQLLEVHIIVLPKGDKDRGLVANYRPISLLNVDVKWYAKALANRLLPHVTTIISLDQVGFVPGREARDNTLRALLAHRWMTSHASSGFFLSLDAEKVFDRVAWDYMFETLTHLGLTEHFISKLRLLYTNPRATIKVNGHL